MAAEMTVLELQEHCQRRRDRHIEEDLDGHSCRGARAAADAVDEVLRDHIERALELWQTPPVSGGRHDAS